MTDSLDIAANMIGVVGMLYLLSERKPRPEDDPIINFSSLQPKRFLNSWFRGLLGSRAFFNCPRPMPLPRPVLHGQIATLLSTLSVTEIFSPCHPISKLYRAPSIFP